MLQAGAIDLAVVDGGFSADGFNSILLDTDHLVVAVSNENPLSEKSFVRLSELRHERLILCAPGSGTRNLFEAHLKSAGMQIGQFKVCARDAEAGRFRIKPIADMNMARQIHMFYRPELRCEELLGDIQRLYYEVMSN